MGTYHVDGHDFAIHDFWVFLMILILGLFDLVFSDYLKHMFKKPDKYLIEKLMKTKTLAGKLKDT